MSLIYDNLLEKKFWHHLNPFFDKIYNKIKLFIIPEPLNKDIFIAVDLNFNFKEKDLLRIAKSFKEFRIKWLEIDSETVNPLIAIKKKI